MIWRRRRARIHREDIKGFLSSSSFARNEKNDSVRREKEKKKEERRKRKKSMIGRTQMTRKRRGPGNLKN